MHHGGSKGNMGHVFTTIHSPGGLVMSDWTTDNWTSLLGWGPSLEGDSLTDLQTAGQAMHNGSRNGGAGRAPEHLWIKPIGLRCFCLTMALVHNLFLLIIR